MSNIAINATPGDNAELDKTLVAAQSVVNRLFFLRDTFGGLSDPNTDKVEFSFPALRGFYEILDDVLGKAQEVTESLNPVGGRRYESPHRPRNPS